MILFTVLLIILAIIAVLAFLALSIGGAAFIVLFGDLIVCIFLIVWIMKRFFRKRRR